MRLAFLLLVSLVFLPSFAVAAQVDETNVRSTRYETTPREQARKAAQERRKRTAERRLKRLEKIPAMARGALTWGTSNAPVSMVMFVDMECPACKAVWRSLWPELKKDYVDPGIMRLAVRHYPLTSIHRYAEEMAVAVVCARHQGDDVARSLFDHIELTPYGEDWWAMAEKGAVENLNVGKLQSCIADNKEGDGAALDVIAADIAMGKEKDVMGTPTFFIFGPGDAGEPFRPYGTVEDIKRTISKASKK